MLKRAFSVLSSLRLTVWLLALGIVLVFFGTLGQVTDGLYDAQERYFKSWFTTWRPGVGSWFVLPLPGGYLLGTALLANLLAAHAVRFKFTWRKSGILLTHLGIILLLLGQLATDMFAVESYQRLTEGQTKSYSESHRDVELAVTEVRAGDRDRVVVFPEALVAAGGELRHPELPFALRVRDYAPNADLQPRGPRGDGEPQATRGLAERFILKPLPRETAMDKRNLPFAVLEPVPADGPAPGTWLVTPYASDEAIVSGLRRSFRQQLGPELTDPLVRTLAAPQEFSVGDRRFRLALRPQRLYTAHALHLLDFKHDKYIGTEKPKDFRSRVRVENPVAGETRETDIYMNQPLRYAGLTYYQSSFDPTDARVTILQVVRNPSWLTPYAGCVLVGGGLLVQFLIHLFGFIAKRAGGRAAGPVPATA
jgi:hypothetical protein